MHTAFWTVCSGTHLTLFPLLATQYYGISLSQLGSLFAIYSLTNAIGSQPAAWWSDKMGRKMAIIPGMNNLNKYSKQS
jgi:MFS family permease